MTRIDTELMRWPRRRWSDDTVFEVVYEGNLLRREYDASGDLRLLDRSVNTLRKAADWASDRPALRSAALSDLGLSLRERARVRSSTTDLDNAIAAHREAYELAGSDSPHRSGMAGNLAGTLRQAWTRTGDTDLLYRSVTLYEEAVLRLVEGSGYGPIALSNLANGLSDRYRISDDPGDLDRAVAAATAAVETAPPGSGEMLRIVDVAAGVLRQHGELHGDRDEVGRAATMARAAWSATDPRSSGFTSRCATVSTTLSALSVMTGDLAALDEAVEACRTGLAVARGDQAAPLLGNLAGLLRLRYDLYSDLDDLELAVRSIEEVLERLEPAPTVMRAGYLDTAAALLRDTATVTGDLDALKTAEAMAVEALTITGAESGAGARTLAQLGGIKRDQWALTDDVDDLRLAVEWLEQALTAAVRGVDAHNRSRTAYMAATAVADLAAATGDADALLRADTLLSELRTAGGDDQGVEVDQELAVSIRHAQALIADERGHDDAAARAFIETQELTRQRYARQVLRRHREGALAGQQGHAAQAAVVLARTGRAEDAVVALELGQAVLASETADRRRLDLARIAAVDDGLALELRAAAGHLDELERTGSAGSGAATVAKARERFDALVDRVRADPRCAGVLAAPSIATIRAAARERPVVYLAAERRGGIAVVVDGDRIESTALPQLRRGELGRRFDAVVDLLSGRGPSEAVEITAFLEWLGAAAVQPWLDRLPDGTSAVCLIPVGPLARVPLHAATVDLDGERVPLLSRVAVSSAPNARIVATASARVDRSSDRILVVADPSPTAAPPLAGARAEADAVAVGYGDVELLVGDAATRDAVLAGVGAADVVHVACHGEAVPRRPADSHLLLGSDERLTVGEIGDGRLQARLVVLSACESGVIGATLPDEAAGFGTALLQAGARGVVVALWRVSDAAAALTMAEFHCRLDGFVPAAVALAAAQDHLRAATGEELATRWPTLVDPPGTEGSALRRLWNTGRPLSDPRLWAAFVHVGS